MNPPNAPSGSQGAGAGSNAGQEEWQPRTFFSGNIPGLNVPRAPPWFYEPNRVRLNHATTSDAQWQQQQVNSIRIQADNVRFFQQSPRAYFASLVAELRAIGPVNASANHMVFFYIKVLTLVNEYFAMRRLFPQQPMLSQARILCRLLEGVQRFYPRFAMQWLQNIRGEAQQNEQRQQDEQPLQPYPPPDQLLQDLRQGMALPPFPTDVDNTLLTLFDGIMPSNRRAIFAAITPNARRQHPLTRPTAPPATQAPPPTPSPAPRGERGGRWAGGRGSRGTQSDRGKRTRDADDQARTSPPKTRRLGGPGAAASWGAPQGFMPYPFGAGTTDDPYTVAEERDDGQTGDNDPFSQNQARSRTLGFGLGRSTTAPRAAAAPLIPPVHPGPRPTAAPRTGPLPRPSAEVPEATQDDGTGSAPNDSESSTIGGGYSTARKDSAH